MVASLKVILVISTYKGKVYCKQQRSNKVTCNKAAYKITHECRTNYNILMKNFKAIIMLTGMGEGRGGV